MVTDLQNEQRELADYIRAGSTRGPCFGSYSMKGGSCALGAVYDALPSAAAARETDSDHSSGCSAASTR